MYRWNSVIKRDKYTSRYVSLKWLSWFHAMHWVFVWINCKIMEMLLMRKRKNSTKSGKKSRDKNGKNRENKRKKFDDCRIECKEPKGRIIETFFMLLTKITLFCHSSSAKYWQFFLRHIVFPLKLLFKRNYYASTESRKTVSKNDVQKYCWVISAFPQRKNAFKKTSFMRTVDIYDIESQRITEQKCINRMMIDGFEYIIEMTTA